MASSSSANPQVAERDPLTENESVRSHRLYDVFINHRGPDVKDTLATQLYQYLKHMGCRSFLDSREIELGDLFPPTIRNAIESALVQIAIFSPRYAESPWCLTELTLMLQTKVLFIPVFYRVQPSDLRHIDKGAYGATFVSHRNKERYLGKLAAWEKALYDASLITGYEYRNDDSWEVLLKIQSAVLRELEKRMPLYVAKHPVGLDELVNNFKKFFRKTTHANEFDRNREKAKIIGIFGMGGSGKTTLAKELFNRNRSEYSGASFLYEVRESSTKGELPSLQAKLLKDLFCEDHPKFQSVDEGTRYLRHRLERGIFLSFLIVLDDIDHNHELDALLVSNKLNSGSLVIVTSRDERVLQRAGITLRYRMKEMSIDCSRQLFCWHACHQPYPVSGYEDLVEIFVQVCEGLPLSLQLVGGRLFGSHKEYWRLELAKFQKTLPMEIKHNIRISFDTLDNEQKQIFMDIACFFIGRGKFQSMAMTIWEGSGWMAEHSLQILLDRCLVEMEPVLTTNSYTEELYFRMHGHIRDFGREMADELSHPRRMWKPQDLQSLDFPRFKSILMERRMHSVRCLHWLFHSSTNTLVTYFIGNSDHHSRTSTLLLWMALEINEHLQISIPSQKYLRNLWQAIGSLIRGTSSGIALESLQGLEIVNGIPNRLLGNDEKDLFLLMVNLVLFLLSGFKRFFNFSFDFNQTASAIQGLSNLKELRLDTKSLQELSKCDLRQLKNLDVYGTDDMPIDESLLSKFPHLRNLALRHLALPGKVLLFEMSELEKVDIRLLRQVRNVSISGCHSLKSLCLEFLEDLIEVDLRGITSLSSLEFEGCRKLKSVSIAGKTNLVDIHIGECWGLQELPGLANHHLLERITIDGCGPRYREILDIEELLRLKYLYISPAYGKVCRILCGLGRLPSQCMTVIAKLTEGAESFLVANFFLGADAISEIEINEDGDWKAKASIATPQPLSAIIVCSMLQITRPYQFIQIPLPNKVIESRIPQGEWIVITIVSDPEKLANAEESNWIPRTPYENSSLIRGVVAAMNEGREATTMSIFKTIIGLLCEWEEPRL